MAFVTSLDDLFPEESSCVTAIRQQINGEKSIDQLRLLNVHQSLRYFDVFTLSLFQNRCATTDSVFYLKRQATLQVLLYIDDEGATGWGPCPMNSRHAAEVARNHQLWWYRLRRGTSLSDWLFACMRRR